MNGSVRSEAAGRSVAPPRFGREALAGVLLGAPALLIAMVPGAARALELERTAMGQLWRWITCHWTHWSVDHLVWDLVAFVVLVLIGWRISPRWTCATLVGAALTIPLGVWALEPEIVRYRGLSGLDSALFAFVAATLLTDEIRTRRWIQGCAIAFVIAGFAMKIVLELGTGATLFADSSRFVPVPSAHLLGAACGWIAFRSRERLRSNGKSAA